MDLRSGIGCVISSHLYARCNYLSMLGLKLDHANNRGSCPLAGNKIMPDKIENILRVSIEKLSWGIVWNFFTFCVCFIYLQIFQYMPSWMFKLGMLYWLLSFSVVNCYVCMCAVEALVGKDETILWKQQISSQQSVVLTQYANGA